MREPTWVSRKIVDALHPELIRQDGGSHGVRDDGMIDSALARPVNRWSYESGCDLPELAASYGYGLAKNHGFVDGNKRIALAVMGVFLYTNGLLLEASEPEVVVLMTDLAAGELGETELAAWLREHVVPITDE
ncbi:MAG TPA: type II toxin-antitoxin system death-on-curing family toxin [Longimicrobiaceae bacterium]|jgi:death-on-curing protein|nr:type II toxin-antitoxin system death-on-curing family toxin [Longimicrobiaceae bacterium]